MLEVLPHRGCIDGCLATSPKIMAFRPSDAEATLSGLGFGWRRTYQGSPPAAANPGLCDLNPVGVREPQWFGSEFTFRRKGEAMKGG